jgi:hypothetical protein
MLQEWLSKAAQNDLPPKSVASDENVGARSLTCLLSHFWLAWLSGKSDDDSLDYFTNVIDQPLTLQVSFCFSGVEGWGGGVKGSYK